MGNLPKNVDLSCHHVNLTRDYQINPRECTIFQSIYLQTNANITSSVPNISNFTYYFQIVQTPMASGGKRVISIDPVSTPKMRKTSLRIKKAKKKSLKKK